MDLWVSDIPTLTAKKYPMTSHASDDHQTFHHLPSHLILSSHVSFFLNFYIPSIFPRIRLTALAQPSLHRIEAEKKSKNGDESTCVAKRIQMRAGAHGSIK
jgi:hypothetical protein